MSKTHEIVCIGSVLWDIIGRSSRNMRAGSDVPGRIERIPGGVALNVAMTLRRFGLSPTLLSVVGDDAEGRELVTAVSAMGVKTDLLYRSADLPTDSYMAVEGANGLIAAIADAHSLEAAHDKILTPMSDGRLGSLDDPFEGTIALDGNLTTTLLSEIATSSLFAASDLRLAPASPGKAERLLPFLGRTNTTFYVNKEEAGLLCKSDFASATDAAKGLRDLGVGRALVTDGARETAEVAGEFLQAAAPPQVLSVRVTGAGDTFMAAHIAAELRGETAPSALTTALNAAAAYVAGETE